MFDRSFAIGDDTTTMKDHTVRLAIRLQQCSEPRQPDKVFLSLFEWLPYGEKVMGSSCQKFFGRESIIE